MSIKREPLLRELCESELDTLYQFLSSYRVELDSKTVNRLALKCLREDHVECLKLLIEDYGCDGIEPRGKDSSERHPPGFNSPGIRSSKSHSGSDKTTISQTDFTLPGKVKGTRIEWVTREDGSGHVSNSLRKRSTSEGSSNVKSTSETEYH